MKESFSFNVNHPYIDVSSFKENTIYKLKSIILGNPNISEFISYAGDGIITFDDERHFKWTVTPVEKFTRGKINAIIFDVHENEYTNPYGYTQIVVFQNIIKNYESIGYVWIKDTDHTIIHFSLEYIDSSIPQHIIRDINAWSKHIIYDMLNHKEPLNVVEYEKGYRKYIEKYRCYKYEDWQIKKINQRYSYKPEY